MIDKKSLLLGAAIGGFAMAMGCGGPDDGADQVAPEIEEVVGECHGINSCKGQGHCGAETHSCAGQNSCKGEGWLRMTEDECENEGGEFQELSMEM